MPFLLPEGLAPEVYPLAWLVGAWRGQGVIAYPGIAEAAFTQDFAVTSDGGPYLGYTSTIRLIEAPGELAADEPVPGPVWACEAGYWRVPPDDSADATAPAAGTSARSPAGTSAGTFAGTSARPGKHPVELLVADPSGHVAVYVGEVGNGRITLVSDVIARTATGADIAAERRLYGLVHGELMWAFDLAAFGHPLQSYASARLSRVEA